MLHVILNRVKIIHHNKFKILPYFCEVQERR